LISRSPETYGEPYRGWLPEDVDLSDVPNVTMMEPRERVWEIFAVTRILLVPSMWAEALARVSVEAFANGIPVIVSAVGSLADHGRRGGIAVDEFRDAGAWTRTIRQLDDPALRADCVERGRRVAREEFSLDRAVGAFADLLGRVVAVPRGARLDAT
jgi:glycosyltransferase involved in cell wall biosynthesis